MADIQVLAPEVVDQIAAGEVVERPAHLVKELVENSIDAGATQIEVDFNQGGRLVRVVDNGRGLGPDQLPLALARHATSKIRQSADIWQLNSFGFRGEALASLSAVSRLSFTSRRSGDDTAAQVVSEFGQLGEVQSRGGDVGTSVVVEELFANVPARLKFLKSDSAEHQQIKNVIKAMALANPCVEFRVRNKGELLFYWSACESLLARAQQVFENDNLYFTSGEYNAIQADVVFSSPNQTVRTSRQMWFFVQNRWVQDRSLQAAVMEAYRNLLMHGEYPIVAAFLHMDPQIVDVNIHPTKSQVKFQNARDVFRALNRSLRAGLEKAPWVQGVTGGSRSTPGPQGEVPYQIKGANLSVDSRPSTNQPATYEQTALRTTTGGADPQFQSTRFSGKTYPSTEGPKLTMDMLREYAPARSEDSAFEAETENTSQSTEGRGEWTSLQLLGQAHLTYLVAQSAKAVVFVDQHAAHERVMFEKLLAAYKDGGMECQNFLLPLNIDMDSAECEAVLSQKAELEKLGLEVEAAGPDSLAVRSGPSFLKDKSLAQALVKLGQEVVDRGDSFAFENSLAEIVATMACHSAIRAGQALSAQEMLSLLAQMDEYPLSSFCPHGRPVFVEYPFQKLEKDFGRIV